MPGPAFESPSSLIWQPRAYLLKALLSATDVGIAVWGRSQPAPPVARLKRNIAYGPRPAQRLDVMIPSSKGRHTPLVFVHGGGWVGGHKFMYDGPCRRFAEHGYCVFNVNYRLSPMHPWPVPFQDVARAVSWVDRHAADYGADPSRIVLAGDSAGAHLVSLYAEAANDEALLRKTDIPETVPPSVLGGLMLFYGVYDLVTFPRVRYPLVRTMLHAFLGSGPDLTARARIASPMFHATPSMPPCFVAAAERDGLYAQSVRFAERLAGQGVACRTLFLGRQEYPDVGHGFLYRHWQPAARRAIREAAAFIGELVG